MSCDLCIVSECDRSCDLTYRELVAPFIVATIRVETVREPLSKELCPLSPPLRATLTVKLCCHALSIRELKIVIPTATEGGGAYNSLIFSEHFMEISSIFLMLRHLYVFLASVFFSVFIDNIYF